MIRQIRVFIADDHQMFIDGIKALLSDTTHIQIVGEANNGSQVLEKLKKIQPDILLMDIGMPELNGIETTTIICEKFSNIKVIALTMYDDRNRVLKMLKAGAKGYILKNTSKNELLAAIETLANGGTYYSPQLEVNIGKEVSEIEMDPISKLTKREVEVIKLIVLSMTNKEIANLLSLSELTVNTHRKNAMQKLEVKNTAGLVKFAMDNNLNDL